MQAKCKLDSTAKLESASPKLTAGEHMLSSYPVSLLREREEKLKGSQ